jgi:hypothetical protein
MIVPDPLLPRDRELWPQAQELIHKPMEDFYQSALTSEPEPTPEPEIVNLVADRPQLEKFASQMAQKLSQLANAENNIKGKDYLQFLTYRLSSLSRGQGLALRPDPVEEAEKKWQAAVNALLRNGLAH